MFQVASIRLFTKSKNWDYFTLISSPALDVFEIFMSVSVESDTKSRILCERFIQFYGFHWLCVMLVDWTIALRLDMRFSLFLKYTRLLILKRILHLQ